MATCRDIVTLGLKQARVIGVNDTPTAGEAEAGMTVLQSLYRSWFDSGEFGFLNDVYKAEDYAAEEQDRITAETGVTITLPTTLSDSSDTYGDGTGQRRAPYELAGIAVVQDSAELSYIWDGSAWVELNSLTLSSTAPLAKYGEAGLAAFFALHYAETFGAPIGPGTKKLADRFISAMRTRRNRANPRAKIEFY